MTSTDYYIFEHTDDSVNENVDLPGWYFWDEASLANGPFSSREEAIEVFDKYVTHLGE